MYMPILHNCYKDLQLVFLELSWHVWSQRSIWPLLPVLCLCSWALRKWPLSHFRNWSTTIMAFQVGFTPPLEAFLIFLRAHLYSPPSISLPTSRGWIQSNYSQEYLVYSHLHVANGGEPHIRRYVPLCILVRRFGLLPYHSHWQQELAKIHYREDNATYTYLERTYVHVHVRKIGCGTACNSKMVVV